MDSFEFNKVAGAVLATALGVMALSIVSEAIFAAGEPEKPGFEVAVAEPAETGTGGTTTAAAVVPIAVRLASADPAAGKSSAAICLGCHSVGKGEAAKAGPNLYNIVNAPAAHMEGFKYSKAMLDEKAKGLTWTFENLDHFLAAPKAFVPGTAMGFAGFKKDDQRANVIAYLRTLSDSPAPLPVAEAPAPAEGAAPAPADGAAPPADANAPGTEAPGPAGATAPTPPTEQPPAVQSPPGEAATPPPPAQ